MAFRLISILKRSNLLKSVINVHETSRCVSVSARQLLPESDRPLAFRGSKAEEWQAVNTFYPSPRDAPWYEKWICMASLSVFFLYFLLLREENGVDKALNENLFKQIPELEESSLIVTRDHYRRQGKDTSELEKRLAEIRADK